MVPVATDFRVAGRCNTGEEHGASGHETPYRTIRGKGGQREQGARRSALRRSRSDEGTLKAPLAEQARWMLDQQAGRPGPGGDSGRAAALEPGGASADGARGGTACDVAGEQRARATGTGGGPHLVRECDAGGGDREDAGPAHSQVGCGQPAGRADHVPSGGRADAAGGDGSAWAERRNGSTGAEGGDRPDRTDGCGGHQLARHL